ncbi:hypothetical protein P168DRAFT_340888 [Aspergillus campestris IBT 28561]|uniref:Uncharacterized protein n=1 Tax=Aspergillus campestris (strain IBT 28561) TaxID=1392248 RepID=A0A2I1D6I2_ASPC2|nr:uncharacterized protein P168DRAFT_340888 [Aspergillus campestris IBT 28561]PKY05480.1 hypothetical protein P168DRAFT_340888 [Aspergillus campestris IBT 28561]
MSPSHSRSRHSRRDHHHQHQDRNLDDLIRRYTQTTQPSPVLADILRSSRESSLLVSALRRQVSLIKCRSPDPRDNQVTVYDRALMELSRSGDDPRHLGALELYLTEYLGIVPIAPFQQGRDVARECVDVEMTFGRARETETDKTDNKKKKKRTRTHTRHSVSPAERRTASPTRTLASHHHSTNKTIHSNPPPPNDEVQTRITRLLSTYQAAKDDYFGSLQKNGMVSMDAARFLRDTAENTLRYLRSNGLAEEKGGLVTELEYTFAAARDKATALSGGRKRHFDEGDGGGGGGHESRRRGGKRSRRVMMDSYRPEG